MREYAHARETFVVNQIAALSKFAPAVVCRRRLASLPKATLAEAPIPIASFEESGRPEGALQRLAYEKLRLPLGSEIDFYVRACRSKDARILHCHFGTDARYFLAATKRVAAPVFISYYGYDVSSFVRGRLGIGRGYLSPLWATSAIHLAMTPQMASTLEALGAPSQRVRVHHHGIDTSFWGSPGRRDPAQPPRILQVASLDRKKGQDDLITAFTHVRERHPDATVRIVGDGPELPRLQRLVFERGLGDSVIFLGHLAHGPQLVDEYVNATVFCHPSKTAPDGDMEGLPGTILEAMATGLAVIATRHAGIPFAVREGRTGWLVDEGDIPALAQALDCALTDAGRREALGVAAQALVRKEFNVRTQATRLEDLYEQELVLMSSDAGLLR
jgi:colanic acid/amylovoran biosynthesis glycosyltransferase